MSRPHLHLAKSGEPDALDIALQDAERRLEAMKKVDAMLAERQRAYYLELVRQGFTAKQALDMTKDFKA